MPELSQGIKGYIFNLDGVIVDTAKYHYMAWRRLSNELGFDFSPQQHETLRGLGRPASLEKILEWGAMYMTEAEKLHWSDVKNNWYLELIAQMKPADVLPGVKRFLCDVRSAGIKTALSSGSKNARTVLRSMDLELYFDVVVDGNSIRKYKPDPDCFLLAAAALGLQPAECLVFEDMPLGIDAAIRGGFPVVGVGNPELLSKAQWVIPGFEALKPKDLDLVVGNLSR